MPKVFKETSSVLIYEKSNMHFDTNNNFNKILLELFDQRILPEERGSEVKNAPFHLIGDLVMKKTDLKVTLIWRL